MTRKLLISEVILEVVSVVKAMNRDLKLEATQGWVMLRDLPEE